jgi:hypothetical protein
MNTNKNNTNSVLVRGHFVFGEHLTHLLVRQRLDFAQQLGVFRRSQRVNALRQLGECQRAGINIVDGNLDGKRLLDAN